MMFVVLCNPSIDSRILVSLGNVAKPQDVPKGKMWQAALGFSYQIQEK